MTLDPAISWIFGLGISLLLGAAAVHKLANLTRFRSALEGYRLLPASMARIAAAAVIGAEALTAVLVVIPRYRALGAWLAATLLVGYALALGVNLARGRTRIDCGCLGFGSADRISWWMVARNVALAAVALGAALPTSGRALTALDLLTVVGSVGLAAVLYSSFGLLGSRPLRAREAS